MRCGHARLRGTRGRESCRQERKGSVKKAAKEEEPVVCVCMCGGEAGNRMARMAVRVWLANAGEICCLHAT